MIKIIYSRRSVCMGDDVNAGEYILSFEDNDTLKDLMERITNVNTERSLAFTGPSTHWIIKSDIGDIAEVTVDDKYEWVIKYVNHRSNTKLKTLNIKSIRGE